MQGRLAIDQSSCKGEPKRRMGAVYVSYTNGEMGQSTSTRTHGCTRTLVPRGGALFRGPALADDPSPSPALRLNKPLFLSIIIVAIAIATAPTRARRKERKDIYEQPLSRACSNTTFCEEIPQCQGNGSARRHRCSLHAMLTGNAIKEHSDADEVRVDLTQI